MGRKPLHTPAEIIEQIKAIMADMGPDAFMHNGRVQLYSGPRRILAQALRLLEKDKNHARAFRQAGRRGSKMIDHTEVGQFAEKYDVNDKNENINLYAYYFEHYGYGSQKAIDSANEVMSFASEEFIKAAHGDVETAVCGADEANVFFKIELPALVKNTNIKTINGIPMDMVREFYAISPYEAFRLICLAELKDIKKDDVVEYQERYKFFAIERSETRKHAPRPAPEIQQKKMEIIAFYKLKLLHDMPDDEAVARPITASPALKPKVAGGPR